MTTIDHVINPETKYPEYRVDIQYVFECGINVIEGCAKEHYYVQFSSDNYDFSLGRHSKVKGKAKLNQDGQWELETMSIEHPPLSTMATWWEHYPPIYGYNERHMAKVKYFLDPIELYWNEELKNTTRKEGYEKVINAGFNRLAELGEQMKETQSQIDILVRDEYNLA